MGKGDKRDRQFGQMIEAAIRWNKCVRIGVNWGSLDQELLAGLMDENSRRSEPWDARSVMYEALITSAVESAKRAEEIYKVEEERTRFGRNIRTMNRAWRGITDATIRLRENLQNGQGQ